MTLNQPNFCAAFVLMTATLATSSQADIQVTFYEGAPKDRVEIVNTGDCALAGSSLVIDLSQSQGGLIFDVTASGQGVEVFQPFEIVAGESALASVPTVLDGQQQIELEIASLAPNDVIAFTIDVDDTIEQREITVTGSEFAGATATYSGNADPVTATFLTTSDVSIPIPTCS